jgi:hypothetical protein
MRLGGETMTERRIRVNAKQTAKGLWQLDVTVEATGNNISHDEADVLTVIRAKEVEFRADSRKMVGENDGN